MKADYLAKLLLFFHPPQRGHGGFSDSGPHLRCSQLCVEEEPEGGAEGGGAASPDPAQRAAAPPRRVANAGVRTQFLSSGQMLVVRDEAKVGFKVGSKAGFKVGSKVGSILGKSAVKLA